MQVIFVPGAIPIDHAIVITDPSGAALHWSREGAWFASPEGERLLDAHQVLEYMTSQMSQAGIHSLVPAVDMSPALLRTQALEMDVIALSDISAKLLRAFVALREEFAKVAGPAEALAVIEKIKGLDRPEGSQN
jgi:hypothetical protein